MADVDYKKMAQAIRVELDANRSVDDVTHADDHNFVAHLREQAKERVELRKHLKKHILVWGSLGLLVGLWHLFEYWFMNFPRGGSGNG